MTNLSQAAKVELRRRGFCFRDSSSASPSYERGARALTGSRITGPGNSGYHISDSFERDPWIPRQTGGAEETSGSGTVRACVSGLWQRGAVR